MNTYFTILVGSLLVNNFVMNKFLGICPFLGVSKKFETSMGMGMAVTFVMTMASFVTWLVNTYLRLHYYSRGSIRMSLYNDGGAVVELNLPCERSAKHV